MSPPDWAVALISATWLPAFRSRVVAAEAPLPLLISRVPSVAVASRAPLVAVRVEKPDTVMLSPALTVTFSAPVAWL